MENNEMVNTVEAAELISIKPQTLEKWRCHKRGPAFYKANNGRILYKKADLIAYMEAKRFDFKEK